MKREISPILEEILKDKSGNEVIVIEGARQVGKSYLVNDVLNGLRVPHISFDLEKQDKIRRQIENTVDFTDLITLLKDQYGLREKSILFIDEAQECPRLADYVKSFKEDLKNIKVILTGSSMTQLFPKSKRIPVGRTRSLCVYPFSFTEFLKFIGKVELSDFILQVPENIPASRHKLLLEYFDKYLITGGYPEAVKAFLRHNDDMNIIEELIAGLAEDFERKSGFTKGLFIDTIRSTANHLGGVSKYTHLNTTKYQAKKIIDNLTRWHVLINVDSYAIEPYKSNFLPKRYLFDIGVANYFRSVPVPKISIINNVDSALRTSLGGLFENAVLLSLLEGESAKKSIGTWKKGNNTDIEVDFILDIKDKNIKLPVECKAATKIYNRHMKNILHYLSLTKQKTGCLVSAAPYEKRVFDNNIEIYNIPVYMATKKNLRSLIL